MPDLKAFSAKRIFNGDSWQEDAAIIVEDGVISDVVQTSSIAGHIVPIHIECSFLAPAFIDLQIYGAYGKLLAVFPEADALEKLNEYCNNGGAAFFLPTIATNTYEVFYKCIDAVRSYWEKGGKGVLGLHIEGPWISERKKGAHVASLIHTPTLKQVEDLLDYGSGVIKMITLAPEICNSEIISLILSRDIIISAGHSNASYEDALVAFDSGVTTSTHLFNAMSPLQHRAPGLTGAIMDHLSVMASIIPDGHHVDFAAVRIAKKIIGDRLFVITDAVTETNEGYYQHYLSGDKYEADGILSGSALTMAKAYFNLVEQVGIPREEALRMCSLYPAKVIRKDLELGRLLKGYYFSVAAVNEFNKSAHVLEV